LPETKRKARAVLTSDFCTINGEHHFVRACLDIPILGQQDRFTWGVWVSISEASIRRAAELYDVDPAADEPPRFGWLSTSLPLYSVPTLNLKTMVRFRAQPLRPRVELEPTDHPLSVEQRNGITLERVQEIAAMLLHRQR
jgi:hypothetical protein